MIKINIICIGNLKEKYLKDAQEEYLKRLTRYASIKLIEVNEAKILSFDNTVLIEKTKENEALNALKFVKKDDYLVLMDLHGKELSSEDLAKGFSNLVSTNTRDIDIVIGGTLGLGESLIKRSNYRICLSKLTFPHQITRIILLEQLYRIFKINNNESYHH